ncbi:MAG: hypothetical protein V3V14_13870 [Saprospiraceae bacterium]
MKLFVFVFTIFNVSICHGQFLKISAASKSVEIPHDSYFIMKIGDGLTNECCNYIKANGSIINETTDSLTMDLNSLVVYNKAISDRKFNKVINIGPHAFNKFAKTDILSFKYYKSQKNYTSNKTIKTISTVLILTGITTAVNSFFVKNSSDKNLLLYAGGAQFGVGLITFALSRHKKYQTYEKKQIWSFD